MIGMEGRREKAAQRSGLVGREMQGGIKLQTDNLEFKNLRLSLYRPACGQKWLVRS